MTSAPPVHLVRCGPEGRVLTIDTAFQARLEQPGEVPLQADLYAKEPQTMFRRVPDALFHPTEPYLFIASDESLVAYDARTMSEMWRVLPRGEHSTTLRHCVIQLAWHGSGDLLALTDTGSFCVISPRNGSYSTWSASEVPSVFGSALGSSQVLGTDRFNIVHLDVRERRVLGRIPLFERAFGFDACVETRFVAARGLDRVSIWDVDAQACIGQFDSPTGAPTVRLLPDNMVAVGGVSGVEVFTYEGDFVALLKTESPVNCLESGPELYAGCQDGRVYSWAAATG